MLFPEEVESLTARLKNWRPAEGSSCGGDSREDGAVPPNFTEEELDEARHETRVCDARRWNEGWEAGGIGG